MTDETKPHAAPTPQQTNPLPSTPTAPSLPRPDVSSCFRLYGNTIQIKSAELFFLISDSLRHLENMQKRSLVTLKVKFKDQEYLSRSEFKVVTAIFRKYRDELVTKDREYTYGDEAAKLSGEQALPPTEYEKKLLRALRQAETIEEEADKVMKTIVRPTKGDFEIRQRPKKAGTT